MTLQAKQDELQRILQKLNNVAVAFSGGVDSTLLLKTAHHFLGSRVLAVTVRSGLVPKREIEGAVQFVRQEGIEHVVVDVDELNIAGFSQNPTNRCYLCKIAVFSQIQRIAAERGIPHILEGSNADDVHDYRPGMQAIKELGILSPLREAGLTKQEIRQLSCEWGLPTWNKPSLACLASRFPYGEEITRERVAMIDAAEQYLWDAGLRQVRVRFHGGLARIETDEESLHWLLSDRREGAGTQSENLRKEIVCRFKEIGFLYVAVDLQGYRTGSMNETLELHPESV
jgi:uncharacterized protein